MQLWYACSYERNSYRFPAVDCQYLLLPAWINPLEGWVSWRSIALPKGFLSAAVHSIQKNELLKCMPSWFFFFPWITITNDFHHKVSHQLECLTFETDTETDQMTWLLPSPDWSLQETGWQCTLFIYFIIYLFYYLFILLFIILLFIYFIIHLFYYYLFYYLFIYYLFIIYYLFSKSSPQKQPLKQPNLSSSAQCKPSGPLHLLIDTRANQETKRHWGIQLCTFEAHLSHQAWKHDWTNNALF